MAIRNMFSQFDEDMNNVITREEFIKVTSLWGLCISGESQLFSAHHLVAMLCFGPCYMHSVCFNMPVLRLRRVVQCAWFSAHGQGRKSLSGLQALTVCLYAGLP